jgi:ADP-dependent phosphofructokinase/glucokinase
MTIYEHPRNGGMVGISTNLLSFINAAFWRVIELLSWLWLTLLALFILEA